MGQSTYCLGHWGRERGLASQVTSTDPCGRAVLEGTLAAPSRAPLPRGVQEPCGFFSTWLRSCGPNADAFFGVSKGSALLLGDPAAGTHAHTHAALIHTRVCRTFPGAWATPMAVRCPHTTEQWNLTEPGPELVLSQALVDLVPRHYCHVPRDAATWLRMCGWDMQGAPGRCRH